MDKCILAIMVICCTISVIAVARDESVDKLAPELKFDPAEWKTEAAWHVIKGIFKLAVGFTNLIPTWMVTRDIVDMPGERGRNQVMAFGLWGSTAITFKSAGSDFKTVYRMYKREQAK